MSGSGRTPGSQTSLREANRARIVSAIKRYGALTQVELAGITGLSQATVSNIVREFTAESVLQTSASTRSGRRASLVTFARATGLVCGIHVSNRHLRVVLSDVNRVVLSEKHMPLAVDHRADSEMNRAAMLLADMLKSIDSDLEDVLGIGIALSAPVIAKTHHVVSRGALRGWTGIDIADSMRRRLRRPVTVGNAANLSALAESRMGASRDLRNVIYIDVGEEIGAGIIIGGLPFGGHHGTAGQLGHTVVDPSGLPCRCGNRGCLDTVAGGGALLRLLEPRYGPMKTSDIVAKVRANDAFAVRALFDAARTIGVAVGNLCNVFDPERVVIGGELAECGESLLSPIRHAMERTVISDSIDTPQVALGRLGLRSAAMGALLSVIQHADVPNAVV